MTDLQGGDGRACAEADEKRVEQQRGEVGKRDQARRQRHGTGERLQGDHFRAVNGSRTRQGQKHGRAHQRAKRRGIRARVRDSHQPEGESARQQRRQKIRVRVLRHRRQMRPGKRPSSASECGRFV